MCLALPGFTTAVTVVQSVWQKSSS